MCSESQFAAKWFIGLTLTAEQFRVDLRTRFRISLKSVRTYCQVLLILCCSPMLSINVYCINYVLFQVSVLPAAMLLFLLKALSSLKFAIWIHQSQGQGK